MRPKGNYSRPTGHLKKVNFYSLFEENVPHASYFWHQVENSNYPEPQLTIFSGKLLNKNSENDKWDPIYSKCNKTDFLKKTLPLRRLNFRVLLFK